MDQPSIKHVCAVCGAFQFHMFNYRLYHYHRCPNCWHVTTYPIPDKQTMAEHYARKFISGNYQLLREASQEYRQVYNDFIETLTHQLRLHGLNFNGLKVLDVGCFTGEFLQMLQSLGADVYGLELQSEAVEIANSNLPGRIMQADVDNADFPSTSFDIISLLGVIEHVVEPMRVLRRSMELLRPGGFMIIQTPNSASLLARVMRGLWPPYAPIEHVHLFSRQSLECALANLGMEGITYKPHWKKLPVYYVYNMLQNYGPEFHRLARPIYTRLPAGLTRSALRFYIGEMIVVARKPAI